MMENNATDFCFFYDWIRKIKIQYEIKKFKEKYPEHFKEEETNVFFDKERLQNYFNKIKNFEKKDDFWAEFILSIEEVHERYTKNSYGKVRAHKILYFLYGFFIYINEKYNLNKNVNNLFIFEDQKDITFSAFGKGPILQNIYKWSEDDKWIKINKSFDDELNNLLKISFILLDNYTTDDLVEESHKTEPWVKNWIENSYYKKIPNEDIENYFKKNKPFFI